MKKCHCGNIIPRGHGFKIKQMYCSRECLKVKPPKVLELEKIFGKSISNIIKEYDLMNNSIQTKAELLGITKQTYYKYKEVYI